MVNRNRPPHRVSLKHACRILPPDKPGEYYYLTYRGLGIIDDNAPEAICHLAKGDIFSIELLRIGTAGGWPQVFARGSVNCGGRTYPVEMELYIAENTGIIQAVYDEIGKDSNRFWTVCKP